MEYYAAETMDYGNVDQHRRQMQREKRIAEGRVSKDAIYVIFKHARCFT